MNHEIANTNVSFEFLKNSREFLNLILNNINSCILLLDKEMKLHAFNDSMKTIFSNHKDEHLLYRRCGEALGCAYQIEEVKDCGKTSRCQECEIRIAAMESYLNNKVIYKEHIEKPFFNLADEKVNKHLQFSTRLFKFQGEKYIIMIVEDITKLMEMKKLLVSN
jgi:sigma-B regulation protein RsbU (phosphoserine phosphatase)